MLVLHGNCIKNILSEISYKYRNKKTFLDVGCGDGSRTVIFDEYGRYINGVDCHRWLKDELKERIDFKQEDFIKTNLTYEDGSFDIIFSFDVIEHLRRPQIMLKEILRILKKDGVFIISTPNRDRLGSFLLCLFGLRKFPYYPNKETINSDPYSAHVIEYSISELGHLLKQEGFKTIKIHRLFYGLSGKFGFRYLFAFPLFHNIILECTKQ